MCSSSLIRRILEILDRRNASRRARSWRELSTRRRLDYRAARCFARGSKRRHVAAVNSRRLLATRAGAKARRAIGRCETDERTNPNSARLRRFHRDSRFPSRGQMDQRDNRQRGTLSERPSLAQLLLSSRLINSLARHQRPRAFLVFRDLRADSPNGFISARS